MPCHLVDNVWNNQLACHAILWMVCETTRWLTVCETTSWPAGPSGRQCVKQPVGLTSGGKFVKQMMYYAIWWIVWNNTTISVDMDELSILTVPRYVWQNKIENFHHVYV